MITQRSDPAAILVGMAGPLGMAALVYLLWPASGGLLHVAPEYANAFVWLVVLPIWLLSSALAALLWGRLTLGAARAAALIAASAIGASFAYLVWIAFDPAGCETSPRTSEEGLLGLSTLLGLIVGPGWAVSGLSGRSAVAAGKLWRGLASTVVIAVGHLVFVLFVFTFVVLTSGGCNRPGIV